jgi:hypothetical protein
MVMEHIGKYKGYNVYKTPKNEMKYNEDRTLYAVAETGELVLKGEVVGKVNFSTGSVTEFDDHKCYKYKYPRKEWDTSVDVLRTSTETPKPTGGRGKRKEVNPVDDYKGTTIADVDLEKMVNDFIMASRTITIEEMVGEFRYE